MKSRQSFSARRAGGFSILELMISLTIGLLLIGAMLSVVLSSMSTGRTRERATSIQDNGRYAIDTLRRDLQHAGYMGGSALFQPDEGTTIAVANACDATNLGRLTQRVFGADDANPYSATCIPAASYARGDVLVIRRLSTTVGNSCQKEPCTVFTCPAGRICYRSAFEGGSYFTGVYTGAERRTPYNDYTLEETVYYVSPFTTSAAESPRVPALWRVRLGAGPAMTPELVATGVENMQVRYGRFDATLGMQYFDAPSVPAWEDISAVQITLLMRGDAVEQGYTNTTTYTIGNQTVTPNDAYRRLEFGSVIQIRN